MSLVPVRKVGSAGLGGAIATGIIWALGEFAGVELGEEVAAAVITVVTFVVGYLVPGAGEARVTLRSPALVVIAAVGASLLLAGCPSFSARIDDATGSTLAERCANYRFAVETLEAIQGADGVLTADQQLRLALYRSLIDQVCLPAGAVLPQS